MQSRGGTVNEPDRHKHTDDHPAHLTTTESRQASPRSMNFRVLIIGTLLVILGGLALGAYFYVPGDNRPPTQSSAPRP
jgi:hypothetical protein